jgi:glycosyltransferase involved in cell wall biosynthesis
MSQAPTISIVIPCYNGARFLSDSIESALQQTYDPTEIIVVDDGSTDRTCEIAKSYPRVKTLSQSHQGVSAARNTGLQAAKGDYLVFLDADDILLPEALNIGFQALNTHENCAFVYGYCEYIQPDGSLLPMPYVPRVQRDFYRRLLDQNFIQSPGATMFRRSSVDYFRTDVYGCEDLDLYLRITRKHDIRCHGKTVLRYRRHHTNMSTKREEMTRAYLTVLRDQLHGLAGDAVLEKLCRKRIQSLTRELAGKRDVRRGLINVLHLITHRVSQFRGNVNRT